MAMQFFLIEIADGILIKISVVFHLKLPGYRGDILHLEGDGE